MARIVLAGKTDCPYYAKAELLADTLQRSLPDFRVRKVPVLPEAWQSWARTGEWLPPRKPSPRTEATQGEHGCKPACSPLVWRELVEQGGRELLIGGFSDFLEHCQDYYGVTSDMSTEMMLSVAAENAETERRRAEEEQRREGLLRPLHVWIAGCLSPTCGVLIPGLLSTDVFPDAPLISLHLLDSDGAEEDLQALRMEIQDLATGLLHQVTVHSDVGQAFVDADVVLMLDECMWEESGPEEEGERRKQLAGRYREYGRLIERRAGEAVKVVVSGDSLVHLRCSLLAESAASRRVVAAVSQLENEAKSVIARRLGVTASDVTDVIVWGDIGGDFHVDVQKAKVYNGDGAVKGPPGFSQPLLEVFHDRKWLETHLQHLTRRRRGAVTSRTGRAAATSAANGILQVMRAWTGADPLLSVGVPCTGLYDLPGGVVLSVPVTFRDGEWSPVTDVSLGDELRDRLQLCAQQLLQEKALAEGSQ